MKKNKKNIKDFPDFWAKPMEDDIKRLAGYPINSKKLPSLNEVIDGMKLK